MASYWDWFEEFRRYMKEKMRRIEDLFNELSEDVSIPFYSELDTRSLEEPLYTIEDHGDSYRILIDLPAADPNSLVIDVLEDYMIIRASLREEVRFKYESSFGKRFSFSNYSSTIRFPIPVDPSSVETERKGNILIIYVKKKHLEG